MREMVENCTLRSTGAFNGSGKISSTPADSCFYRTAQHVRNRLVGSDAPMEPGTYLSLKSVEEGHARVAAELAYEPFLGFVTLDVRMQGMHMLATAIQSKCRNTSSVIHTCL